MLMPILRLMGSLVGAMIFRMNTELIAALNRLATAHEKLAENMGRIADALTFHEGRIEDLSAVDGVVDAINNIRSSIDSLPDELERAKQTED